jgi:hypothetical protein
MQQCIDVALRLFDLAELPIARLCLFGLLSQRGGPIIELPKLHVHLLTQRLTFNEVREVRGAIGKTLAIEETATVTVRNWDYAVPYDLRAPLLNLALENSVGRYFMCLDSSEQLRPGGLAALLGRLTATGIAAATGGIAVQPVVWWGDAFLPTGSARGASAQETPGPIFLLDRFRIDGAPRFLAGDPLGERSGFISRIRQGHAVDEELLGELVCIRHLE